MPEIFQYGFMVRALAAGLMIGTIAPTIGVFLVLRRLSLIADTLAHVALAGVALALLTGIPPVAGALGVGLLGAVGVERLRVSGRLYGDAALAIFLSGGLALAVVLMRSARVVIPAATSLRLARNFRGALLIAVLAALTSVVAGIVLAFYLNIAAGGAIVACAILLFAASAPLVRRP